MIIATNYLENLRRRAIHRKKPEDQRPCNKLLLFLLFRSPALAPLNRSTDAGGGRNTNLSDCNKKE